ncbi:hypothetical protein X798_01189 [Onchocerca flexuosa]|uniref:PLOD1-3-like GT domain-containing protein n=1 Tax=Onchocerca flexuosa TaxID=387005 RepID=A0A238C529_9BILA|nr:hypothetical protein X798_01189 [Onchocerca flexuosa]
MSFTEHKQDDTIFNDIDEGLEKGNTGFRIGWMMSGIIEPVSSVAMYSLVIWLLFLVSSSLTDKCDSSVYKLIIFALSNGNNDALERLRCSTERYNIVFKIFNFGRSSTNQHESRKDSKLLRMLTTELNLYGASNSTILLIIDGFDAIITSDENDIICQFLDACSNCRALLTSKMISKQENSSFELLFSEIRSVALIGFVPNILNVLHFVGSQDDKVLSYSSLYSDDSVIDFKTYEENRRSASTYCTINTLGLTFDVKRILFQNIDSASSEVMLSFHDSGDAYVSNYIGKAWSAENGYMQCGVSGLLRTSKNTWPSVTLALFITKPIPFVREFLATVEEFLKNAKKLYRTIEYDSSDTGLDEREARKTALLILVILSQATISYQLEKCVVSLLHY